MILVFILKYNYGVTGLKIFWEGARKNKLYENAMQSPGSSQLFFKKKRLFL